MKLKLSISTKLIVYILSVSVAIYLVAIGFISIKTRNANFRDATRLADTYAAQYANLSKVSLSSYMFSTNTIADIFENYREIPEDYRRELFAHILKVGLQNNPDFLSVWSIWETQSLDNKDAKYANQIGSTVLGNFRHVYYKQGSQIKLSEYVEKDPTQVLSGKIYTQVKTSKNEVIVDPYYYSYTGLEKDRVLETNLVTPILTEGKFNGVVGIDVPLGNFQKMIDYVHPFKQSYAILVSNNGTIIAHPRGDNIGKNLGEINKEDEFKNQFLKKIKEGQRFSFIGRNLDNQDYYITFHPIVIGQTTTPWSFGIVVPVKVIMSEANYLFLVSIMVGIIGLLLMAVVIVIISRNITRPIIETTKVLKNLALGDFNIYRKLTINQEDEVGEMAKSVNQVIDGLHKTAIFAGEIGKGNLDAQFDLLSEKDVLGNSLLEMRKSLQHAEAEDERRKHEDEMQRWAAEGLSKINEFLRTKNKLADLGFHISGFVVDYLRACQAGFYVVSRDRGDEVTIDLACAIAFNRHRLIKKSIMPGEGMVGRCFQEKLTIHLTEIPDEFAEITSGLGGAKPKSLLVVPLKINEMVFGIMELMSFYVFEPHHIAFLEKAGEAIASAISMVKINEQTEKLLHQSQIQADELAQKEEELRQNLEEMAATQEESSKREQSLKDILDAVHQITLFAVLSVDGKIMEINEDYARILGINHETAVGRQEGFLDPNQAGQDFELWEKLKKGMTVQRRKHLLVRGQDLWLSETYKPVIDVYGSVSKIVKIAFDITEYVQQTTKL